MVLTRADFIRRWKKQVAGTIALGTGKARAILVGCFTGHSSAETMLRELDETAEELIGRLYDDLNSQLANLAASVNGSSQGSKRA